MNKLDTLIYQLDRAARTIESLRDTLQYVAELIDEYVDADHNGNSFVPNAAMRAVQLIDEALGHE